MAQRRMVSMKIVDTDAFLDMPTGAQNLYFHLCIRADDDGFVANPKKIMRMIGVQDDDYKILIAKRFILTFENGVCVIKHWLIHNLIRKDMYKETEYKEEKETLGLNENGSYTELRDGVSEIKKIEAPDWLQERKGETVRKRAVNGTKSAPRIGKDRIGKDRIEREETPAYKTRQFFTKEEYQVKVVDWLKERGVPEEVSKKEIKKFVSYWTELNKTGTKERWELQSTFEVNKRLNTWFSKINSFKATSQTKGRNIII